MPGVSPDTFILCTLSRSSMPPNGFVWPCARSFHPLTNGLTMTTVWVERDMTATATTVDERIEKILLKLRKKATSVLSIKAICDALVALEYDVERKGRGYDTRLTITTPDGEKTEVFTGKIRDYELTGWLFAETLLAERAAAALGLPTVEKEKEERDYKARDWTNTGTCPCCFSNVKLHGGHIVLHGYLRPGHGYTVGSCYGVRYEPYEASTKGTEDLRDFYASELIDTKELLATLKADGFIGTFTGSVGWGRNKRSYPIAPDHSEWDRCRKAAIANTEENIRHLKSDIKTLTVRIDAWKPGLKMPEEIAREKGWLK